MLLLTREPIMTDRPTCKSSEKHVGTDAELEEIPKIFVVEDECIVREGICAMLRDEGWDVESFESCEVFLDLYRQRSSTCLVLDMHFPGMDGLELLGRISDMPEAPPVVIMSGSSQISEAVRSIRDGASDFIEKPVIADRLIASVKEALERTHHADKILAYRDATLDHTGDLTARQRQIMELVVDGHPSKNIAADLGISQRTVEKHRASIMDRTGAKSIPDLSRLVACSHCALLT
jgi:two-component system CheB/CheR fusion protein